MLCKSKRLAIVLLLICLSNGTTLVKANEQSLDVDDQGIIEVQFISIEYFRNWFDVSSQGIAAFTTKLIANDADNTQIYCSIQKYVDGMWISVNSWSSKKEGNLNELSQTYYLPKGFSYRLKATAYVYKKGSLLEKTEFTSQNVNFY